MTQCDSVIKPIVINKPIVVNVYLHAHYRNNQFLVELNNKANNVSKKIVKEASYIIDGQSDEYIQGFPFLTKVDMYKVVHALLERHNIMTTHQINFSTHKLLFITSATIDISKESACYARNANVCIEIDKTTIINRNEEHNFVIIERELNCMIMTFKQYKCVSCDNKMMKAVTYCGRCGTKQNKIAH